MSTRYVTIRKFSQETGFSEDAIRSKIKRGEWLEGDVFLKAGGTILMDYEGYEKWVEDRASGKPQKVA